MIFYTEDKEMVLVLKLGDAACTSSSHNLVVVKDLIGRVKQIWNIENSDNKSLPLTGLSRNNFYTMQVYGLTLYKDRQDFMEYPGVEVFSVEARKISLMTRGLTHDKHLVEVTIQKASINQGVSVMSSLGEIQEAIEVEVDYRYPLNYSVKLQHLKGHPQAKCLILIYSDRKRKQYLMMSPLKDSIPLLPICQSRTNYKVQVVTLTEHLAGSNSYQSHPGGTSSVIHIKTCMVKHDLQQLLDRATDYCHRKSKPVDNYKIKQFYCNKSSKYFEDIMTNHQGVMKKYCKDDNGDPFSPINGQIDGLFFSASLNKKGRPPNFSYFGDNRLFIPAEALLTDDIRLYFADFFCHYKVHYATVVITKKGSVEDKFCEERLIELEKNDNPLFKITVEVSLEDRRLILMEQLNNLMRHFSPNGSSLTNVNSRLGVNNAELLHQNGTKIFSLVSAEKFHVEFLYTEDVDISGLMRTLGGDRVYMKHVRVKGRGGSKKEGIPKCNSCALCNLGPMCHTTSNDLYI